MNYHLPEKPAKSTPRRIYRMCRLHESESKKMKLSRDRRGTMMRRGSAFTMESPLQREGKTTNLSLDAKGGHLHIFRKSSEVNATSQQGGKPPSPEEEMEKKEVNINRKENFVLPWTLLPIARRDLSCFLRKMV